MIVTGGLGLSEHWKRENLSGSKLKPVLEKATEIGLFGQTFSGFLIIDQTYICFVSEGLFTGIVHLSTGQFGSELFASLPETPLSLELRQAHLEVHYTKPEGTRLQNLVDFGEDEWPPHLLKDVQENLCLQFKWEGQSQFQLAGQSHDATPFLRQSLNYHLACWFIQDYFFKINASGNTTALKYIYTWIAAVQSLWFEQELIGADGRPRCFSVVSYGEVPGEEGHNKVLHLFRIGAGQAADVLRFLEDAIAVKKHLIKTGDIGGALYLSTTEYSTEALELFYARTVEPRKAMGLGVLDKLTKYKGFVRMGLGRGFHLILLQVQPGTQNIEVVAPLNEHVKTG